MTASAQQFITPLTLQVLSEQPVCTNLFDLEFESQIGHIQVARAADVVANMTFPPAFLVEYHTAIWTALPGDVLSTGTPGAAAVSGGDVVECRITGFPALRNPVRDLKIT